MKLFLTGLVSFYWLLFRCVGVFAAGDSNGSSNGGAQFELKVDTRKDTDDCKYLKCDLDGLESHLLYTKTDHVVSKVTDGSTELWTKQNNLECLGGVFSYKNSERKLALLVLLDTSTTSTKPLQTKPFKYDGNKWEEKAEADYYNELKSLREEPGSPQYKDLDLTKESELAKLSNVTKTKLGFEVSLYLPQEGDRLNKVSDGNNEVWQRDVSNNEYGLYCLFGKKDDNFKFLVLVVRKDDKYEDKYFLVDNNQWKNVTFEDFKKKLAKVVAAAKLRGNGKNGKNGNGGNGKNGK